TPPLTETLTLVLGYLMQALGIAAYVRMGRCWPNARLRHVAALSCALYVVLIATAVLGGNLASCIVLGFLANIFYGIVAAEYLRVLASHVRPERRATVFGASYAAAAFASWLLSLVPGSVLSSGVGGIGLCALISIPSAVLLWNRVPEWPCEKDAPPLANQASNGTRTHLVTTSTDHDEEAKPLSTFALACLAIAFMGLVKSAGYGFPSTEVTDAGLLELARVLYGVGLLAAGIASDKERKLGVLCCFCSLVSPFLALALEGHAAPALLIWAVEYLLFGFFSVYRVVLMADLCEAADKPHVTGAGLMWGRVGEATGAALCLALAPLPLVLTCVATVLFVCAAVALFLLYQRLYIPRVDCVQAEDVQVEHTQAEIARVEHAQVDPVNTVERVRTAAEIFERFAVRHDLTAREGEVLRLVLDNRTTTQIATELFVSENTIKYHVRNLLKKTGCKNRREIKARYVEES
ncbi:MAG: LuxR C-terminal-related transcriptional regulator, partial [Atopobiaceae bacterium]|nr:LuxR C-terminal-related transcriptional regulator [Atopobiaceae bacterium]